MDRPERISARLALQIALHVVVFTLAGCFLIRAWQAPDTKIARVSISKMAPFLNALSFHPAVDAKLQVLREDFNYREHGARSVSHFLDENRFSNAYKRAYLETDGAAMADVLDRFRKYRAEMGEDEFFDAGYASIIMLDALDSTLLFEALVYDVTGEPALALQRYNKYLDLVRRLRTDDFDPAVRDIDGRLTVVRIKAYLLTHYPDRSAAEQTPYLTKLGMAYVGASGAPIERYRVAMPRIFSRTTPAINDRMRTAIGLMDYCLEAVGPHRTPENRGASACSKDKIARSFGSFGFPAVLIEHNRLHNELHRDFYKEAMHKLWAQENDSFSLSKPPPPSYRPELRAGYERNRMESEVLIRRVNSEVPEATFLVDDLINLLAHHVVSNSGYLFTSGELAAGRDKAEVRNLICSIAPVIERTAANFDQRYELVKLLGGNDQCNS